MAKKVMIDPGHAPGNVNRGPTGHYEYQSNWKVSNYLKAALTRCGIQADLTRKENEDPSLAARGRKARGYDLFISEHSNALNGTARGVEVYYSLRRPNDKPHAEALAAAVSKVMGNPNRGAKTKAYSAGSTLDYYGVIRNAEAVGCPHIFLAENGFHDNPVDEAFLKQDSNLKKIAEAQAKVICGILGVKYVPEGSTSKATPATESKETLYRVQVGAFKNKSNANALKAKLEKDGYSTFIAYVDGLYKVQVGAFKIRSNADKLAAELKKKGYDVFISTAGSAPASSSTGSATIKVGDKVRVKSGAKTYDGKSLASFVYTRVYDVIEVKGDRVVIGIGSAVTAAVKMSDLIKQ